MEPEHSDMDGQNSAGEFQAVHARLTAERDKWKRERAELLARIARLEQSESLFRGILEAAPYTAVLYDQNLTIRYVNPATAGVRGLPQEAFLGKRFSDLWPEAVVRQVIPLLERALEKDEPESAVISFSPPGQSPAIRLATAVRIPTDDGYNVLVISHDITAQRKAMDELREADHHKSEFIAILSHELRNPLGVMRNNLSILERSEPQSTEAKEAHAALRRQTSQLSR